LDYLGFFWIWGYLATSDAKSDIIFAGQRARIFAPEVAKYPKNPKTPNSPKSGSESKNMTSDFAPEVAKYPEKIQMAQNGDLEN